MRLIIDIPEVDYELAKQRWMRGNSPHKMDYYVLKGIPLDDVKAEMLKYSSEHYVHDDDVWTYIGIIDKHIGKAESEE